MIRTHPVAPATNRSHFIGVPRETTLGRKSDFIKESPFKVVEIIPSQGLGRFGLQPNQQLPLNAYAPLRAVQGDVIDVLSR